MKQRFEEGQFSVFRRVHVDSTWAAQRWRWSPASNKAGRCQDIWRWHATAVKKQTMAEPSMINHEIIPIKKRRLEIVIIPIMICHNYSQTHDDQPFNDNISDHSDICFLNFQEKVTNSCWILPKSDKKMLRLAAPATATSAAPVAPVAPAALGTAALPGLDPWGFWSVSKGHTAGHVGINPGEFRIDPFWWCFGNWAAFLFNHNPFFGWMFLEVDHVESFWAILIAW